MHIDFEYQGDVCILRTQGRFATGLDADYLRAKTDEIKKSGRRKVLADFHEVPYIDSTGIGFLVGVYTSVTNTMGGRFVVAGPNPRVREVLDLMRLSSVIPIAADEAAGMAYLQAEAPAARSAEQL
jgi:anti-sigma B factor antagonist